MEAWFLPELNGVSPAWSLSEGSSAVPSSEMKEPELALPTETPRKEVINTRVSSGEGVLRGVLGWWTMSSSTIWFTEGLDETKFKVSEEKNYMKMENEIPDSKKWKNKNPRRSFTTL